MRVLVVEDERDTAEVLAGGLTAEGDVVDVAGNGVDGLWKATENAYDVIVLDVMLPGLHGYQVARRLREAGRWTPVLMLTAMDEDVDHADTAARLVGFSTTTSVTASVNGLAVLTGRDCASACKVVSGAVKDLRLGALVGTRTAGIVAGLLPGHRPDRPAVPVTVAVAVIAAWALVPLAAGHGGPVLATPGDRLSAEA